MLCPEGHSNLSAKQKIGEKKTTVNWKSKWSSEKRGRKQVFLIGLPISIKSKDPFVLRCFYRHPCEISFLQCSSFIMCCLEKGVVDSTRHIHVSHFSLFKCNQSVLKAMKGRLFFFFSSITKQLPALLSWLYLSWEGSDGDYAAACQLAKEWRMRRVAEYSVTCLEA